MSQRKSSLTAATNTLVLILLLLAVTPNLQAGGRRRAVAAPHPSSSGLSLTFLDSGRGDTAAIDAGTMSWRGGRNRFSVTTRTFALRIGPQSSDARGTATLRAYLETADPHATIRIDGIVLGTAPRVIQRNAPLGIAVTHRLEIEVPVTAPDGAIAASIGWEVTTE
jgi:hypothetical protein